ncbi:MAG: hypothetical protein NUW22_04630 [Acidobacteria bacterium]|nr:hypothetical protein [Acidobacteriota bacterium]
MATRLSGTRLYVAAFCAVVLAGGAGDVRSSAQAPMELVVSRNVNMVSGQALPNGDPYLQRQNEPSVAASTRNPLHLLAGANDYRTVDIPGSFDDGETGDAWLGVFKSFDGGERWQSTLLPGYPQDASPEGMASPLKAYHAGADPVVRPGTNGLIYYSGLAFNRGEGAPSAIFVSRFVDNNNKENGDPIAYLSTAIVASSTGASFLDKPWMAVDVPRAGARVCRIQNVQAPPVVRGRSNDRRKSDKDDRNDKDDKDDKKGKDKKGGGQSPRPPQQPRTVSQQILAGTMYVAYASITTTTNAAGVSDVTSKIMLSRSEDCGATWTKPQQISRPEDKVNQGATIAIDPRTGAVHVAWRQFGLSETAPDAMMIVSSAGAGRAFDKPRRAHEFPTGRRADQLLPKLKRSHRMGDVHELVSIKPFDSGTAEDRFRTNAYPTMAIDDESRVYLAWTERGYGAARPDPTAGDARVVLATSKAGGPWTTPRPVDSYAAGTDLPGHQMMPSMTFAGGRLVIAYYDLRQDVSRVFGAFVDENDAVFSSNKRHTIDLRAVQAPKGDVPVFGESTMVSQYLMGNLRGQGTSQEKQLQFNAPNLPLFQLGSVPFMGDYIDIAPAPAFVQSASGQWTFNTASTTAPVFHAVWTDNRDVQKPRDGNWKNYTPPGVAACAPGQTGMRNQNVYSARLTMGLLAGSPGNTKPLDPSVPRAFVVFAQNTTYTTKNFRLTIAAQPVGGQASFDQLGLAAGGSLLTSVDVTVAPRSMVTRTVYATSSDPKTQVAVDVAEILAPQAPALVSGGLASRVILNPDISNPDISNPDISNPDISNPDISNAEVYNPDISNPDISNPDISNPDISNPDISNPDISNVRVANPDISNPDISNPDISNPDISNPDISNPDISNPDISNGTLTDVTWTVTNTGNTTAAFNVNLFLARQDAAAGGIKTQLVVHKTYTTPVSNGCDLGSQTQTVLVANVLNPTFKQAGDSTAFDPANPDISNTTLWLEPGGTGKITLRIVDPDPKDEFEINPVEDLPTPVVQSDPINTENLSDPTPEPPATPAPTDPPAPPAPDMVELAYLLPFVPTATIVDQPLAPIVVRAVAGGNPAPGVQVTLAIATNPSGGHLNGVTTVLTDGNGDATFAGLFIERAGVGYRLSASASAAGAMPIISAPFAIKAIPVVMTVWDETAVFDGLLHPATCTVTGLDGAVLTGAVVIYTSGTAPVNVGTYGATCTFAGGALYEPGSDDATLVIWKASSTTTVTCPASVVYTGSAQEVCSAIVTGAGGLDLTLAVTYSGNTTAGLASANAAYAGDSNHDGSNGGAGFTITKASTTTSTTGGMFTYDGASHGSVCTVTSPSGASVTGTVTYTPGGAAAPVTAGSYGVSCVFAGDANHDASSGTNTITITARAATVTAGGGTKVYGSADPALSPVTTSFLVADAPGITLGQSRAAGEAVATYPVTALASGGNVGNYAVSYVPGAFTITKAATVTTVTCPASVPYTGGPQQVCAATVTGAGGLNEPVAVTYANNTAAGTATATATYAGSVNHNASSDSATFTILSPALTGEWSGNYSWDCGPGRTGTASISLTINAPNAGGWLSTGAVTYLGGTGPASISRYSGAVLNPDPFGNIVRITVPVSTGDYANNEFDGTLTNPGVPTITGTTLNGDTSVVGDGGCSAVSGPSGTFTITKTPNPFVVTTSADGGPGSLRDVMTLANSAPGHDTVRFNIPGGGEQVIALTSPLPVVASPMAVLGQTQPGYDGWPMVRVDGQGTGGYGFELQHKSKISGLSITRFTTQAGVVIMNGGAGSVVELNHIGTDRNAAAGMGNGLGVRFNYVSTAKVQSNLISGNVIDGVLVAGGYLNEIRQNHIGTGLNGYGALPNGDNGITVYDGADNTIIYGNVISGNGAIPATDVGDPGWGIDIQQSASLADVTATWITHNIIGLDASGAIIRRGAVDYIAPVTGANFGPVDRGNAAGGIRVHRGSGTVIGSRMSSGRNTISGNTTHGVLVTGPTTGSPVISHNYIGTDPTGTQARGNGQRGVVVDGSAATIGQPGEGNDNVISGNIRDGVFANGHTRIESNLIGTNAAGTAALGNGLLLDGGTPFSPGCCHAGIFVVAPNNVVRSNVVGGHNAHDQFPGIRSEGALGAQPNVLEDNFIGTNATQTVTFPNGVGVGLFGDRSGTMIRRNVIASNILAGVWLVEGTEGASVGGAALTDGNTIRNNGTGVMVGYNPAASDARNAILSNWIYSNLNLGIDLGWNGVTANDVGDGDNGPNGQQNFPELANASNAGATTTVDYTFDSLQIDANHTIQVFASAVCGSRNGERLVGSFIQQTNGSGDAAGQFTLTELVPGGQVLTATATDAAGNTSEFSACVTVPAAPAPAFTSWASSGNGTVTTTDNGVADGTPQMTYAHNGDQGGPLPDGPYSGAWQFSTVATGNGPVNLDWSWGGFHSYFQVRAGLQAFVNRGGTDVSVVTLLALGPQNCCFSPSGGFNFSGSTIVTVMAGDTFGFRLTGSHFDGTEVLQGTFSVIVDGTAEPVSPPDATVESALPPGPQPARPTPIVAG